LAPVAAEPLPQPARSWPAERERRKRHQVVRFDRRAVADHRSAESAHEPQPVRELKPGRRKNHMVVRFEAPQGHGPHPEPDPAWQLFGQVEA
ncbi:MAG: hypothetical protein H0T69_14315, partial [Thermoleophilaceae bacterium]|nr:hypothetical protein [Thermoleophilaceae bacterium]